jgi:hypothetical protein
MKTHSQNDFEEHFIWKDDDSNTKDEKIKFKFKVGHDVIDELEENLKRCAKWNGHYQIVYTFKMILNVVSCAMLCLWGMWDEKNMGKRKKMCLCDDKNKFHNS